MKSIPSLILPALAASLTAIACSQSRPSVEDSATAPAVTSAEPEKFTSGSWSTTLPLGLQADAAYVPDENPMSAEKVELGRLLYFDPRLSKDGTVSCASCHNPFHGFADPARTSKGVAHALGGRNSPTVINRLFSSDQFWDGRAKDLEEQAGGPMINPVEMAMASHDVVVSKLRRIKGYAPLYTKAFGSAEITIERTQQAIATYERTVLSGNSPFDRYAAGDTSAMSTSAVRGMEVFNGKGNCKACHAGFNFSDENYRNLGVGMDAKKPDAGRMDFTKNPADMGRFKTPTLRNVTQTAPYMHDGSEATLLDVVNFYDRGGVPNPNLDAEVKPLGLTDREKADLVAFMEALTGDVTNARPPDSLPQ